MHTEVIGLDTATAIRCHIWPE